jgi:beta-N-acetylglucosaminidase
MKNKFVYDRLIYRFLAAMMTVVLIVSSCAAFSVKSAEVKAATDTFEDSISGFPETYKTYLRTLHKKYPNWKFVPYNTGIDFATAVSKEYEGDKSLIENAFSRYLKSNASGDYNASTGKYIAKDGGSWVSASKNCIAYFMDPRHFLNDTYMYMFEQLSYDSATQTQAGVEAILQGSFMYKTNIGYLTTAGKYKSSETLYSSQILSAAKTSKVSAYYLASKILQEIGTGKNSTYAGMGSSGSINGNYSSAYKGIYNFYNIGATSGSNPIANGLSWASSGTTYQRPWNTPFKSITGGAQYIGEKYINCGQNTIYYQRFNVNI